MKVQSASCPYRNEQDARRRLPPGTVSISLDCDRVDGFFERDKEHAILF
jgi:hypothetical protein